MAWNDHLDHQSAPIDVLVLIPDQETKHGQCGTVDLMSTWEHVCVGELCTVSSDLHGFFPVVRSTMTGPLARTWTGACRETPVPSPGTNPFGMSSCSILEMTSAWREYTFLEFRAG